VDAASLMGAERFEFKYGLLKRQLTCHSRQVSLCHKTIYLALLTALRPHSIIGCTGRVVSNTNSKRPEV
jgi:hypothetical protein